MLKTFRKSLLCFMSLLGISVLAYAKPKVNLSIWADDGTLDVVTKRLDEFKSAYSREASFNFTVIEQSTAFCGVNVKSNPELAADVFTFVDDQIVDLLDSNLLLPVKDDVSKTVMAECGGESSAAVLSASRNGTLYAFPQLAGNGYFLYYNKKYISTDDTVSFEQLLKAAGEKNKYVAMDLKNGWYLYSFFKGAGLDVYRDGSRNFCNWNSTDKKYKGLDVAKSIINLSSNPAFVSADNDEMMELINSGKVVACVNGAWNAAFLSEKWGKDYGAVKLPVFSVKGDAVQMYSLTGFKLVAVKANTKEPEWALKVAQWLSDEKSQLAICKKKGECPANVKAASSSSIKNSPAVVAMTAQSKYSSAQRIGNSFWNPALVLGVVLSDGKNLTDREIQIQLDITAKNIRN